MGEIITHFLLDISYTDCYLFLLVAESNPNPRREPGGGGAGQVMGPLPDLAAVDDSPDLGHWVTHAFT